MEVGCYRILWFSSRNDSIDGLVDPTFMTMTRDPDLRRKEQWEKAAQAQAGWAWGKWLGLGGIGASALTATEQDSLHGRYLARANAVNLTEVAEMKILYVHHLSTLITLSFIICS